jgi:hypothetical protein
VTGIYRELAADASFLINLISTQIASELLSLERLVLVLPPIAYYEVQRNRSELDRLIRDGQARIIDLPPSSVEDHVNAAKAMDDGEAAVVALGIALRVDFATDDGCAIDYLVRVVGVAPQHIMGICELLQLTANKIGVERAREVLIRIRQDAKFAPPRKHAQWWRGIVDGAHSRT